MMGFQISSDAFLSGKRGLKRKFIIALPSICTDCPVYRLYFYQHIQKKKSTNLSIRTLALPRNAGLCVLFRILHAALCTSSDRRSGSFAVSCRYLEIFNQLVRRYKRNIVFLRSLKKSELSVVGSKTSSEMLVVLKSFLNALICDSHRKRQSSV